MRRNFGATFGVTLGSVALAGIAVLGGQWYYYVAHGSSPYDEIGIELNSRMPKPLREWGCARVAERFPRTLPPYGCER